jgi:hypothetical protein
MEHAQLAERAKEGAKEGAKLRHLRGLLHFLEVITGQETNTDRFVKYFETWTKLQGRSEVQYEMWDAETTVHDAYRGDKVLFWSTLRDRIDRHFTAAVSVSPAEIYHYNGILKSRVNDCLKKLDEYIAIQTVQYHEDKKQLILDITAQYFMEVILWLFAVPQRSKWLSQWDVIESIDGDSKKIDMMIDACEFYQGQEELMTFLGDCAVVVLLTGCFELPSEIEAIIAKYKELMEKTHKQYVLHFSVEPDRLAAIKIMEDDKEENLRLCAVCKEKTRDVILMPCNHCALCHECVVYLTKCPVCRERIEGIESVNNYDIIRAPVIHSTQLPPQSVCSLLTQLSMIR